MSRRYKIFFLLTFIGFFLSPIFGCKPVYALQVGALLYRTSAKGLMYGYNDFKLTPLHIYPGHVGIYIGKNKKGIDTVLEANEGVVREIPAKNFVNLNNREVYLGAKIPKNFSQEQFSNILDLIDSEHLLGQSYDFDFRRQKGPNSGDWTCCKKTI